MVIESCTAQRVDRFLRLSDVKLITGLSRSQIYLLISKCEFPKQIKLSEKASAWLQSEICEWMEFRVSKSRSTGLPDGKI